MSSFSSQYRSLQPAVALSPPTLFTASPSKIMLLGNPSLAHLPFSTYDTKFLQSSEFLMRTATTLSLLRSLSTSLQLHLFRQNRRRGHFMCTLSFLHTSPSPFLLYKTCRSSNLSLSNAVSPNTLVEHLECSSEETGNDDSKSELSSNEEKQFDFDGSFQSTDLKRISSPSVEVKALEDLPEQWRRSRLAWLCKELPGHKPPTMIRVLNAQRKWMKQEDATYVAVHCMRIRENETGFGVKFASCCPTCYLSFLFLTQ